MELFAIEYLNLGYKLADIFSSVRRNFPHENRLSFCAMFGVPANRSHYVRIFPAEKTCSLIFPEDINGDVFAYKYENLIFIIPAEEVAKCDLSGDFCHTSQLNFFEQDGERYKVKKIYDVEDLTCNHCGKFLLSEDFITAADDTFFCSEECAESENYKKCHSCDKYYPEDDLTEIEGADYCEECKNENFHICDHCGEYIHEDDAIFCDGYYFCCDDCANREGFCQCRDCGDYFRPDDEEEEYCSDCMGRATREAKHLINSYGYKPEYDFYHTPEDTSGARLYFGAEVEIAFPFDDFSAGINALNDAHIKNASFHYLKHDSTAGDLGVEIVTMPATLAFLSSEKGKNRIADIFNAMDENSAYKHSECGMHVHISRAGIVPEQEIKLEIFFQRHRSELEKIAGRRGNSYCNYPPASRDYTHNGGENCRAYNQSGRYRALNWENSRTLEIRIFDSVVNMRDFYKNIEFCHAVYQYTKTAELDTVENGDFSEFSAYVVENSSRYPHLTDFFNA